MKLKNFRAALIALGKNDRERAETIGVSLRTLDNLKAGRLPLALRRLLRPGLLLALAVDVPAEPARPVATERRGLCDVDAEQVVSIAD